MMDYKKTKINDEILMIEEISYLEHSNIFVVGKKDNCYVFDAGIGIGNLKKYLHSLGYSNFTVLISHSHFDHFGGLMDFDSSEILLNKKIHQNLTDKQFWAMEYINKKDFADNDIFEHVLKKLDEMISFAKTIKPSNFLSPMIVGNSSVEIIETPGHTLDSIILYDKTHNVLLTGDSLYVGKAFLNCVDSDKIKMIESLNKIKNLKPLQILPGHNQIIKSSEVGDCIEDWINKILKAAY